MRVQPHPSERGSAAIEFAISVIVLVMLVFGCIGVTMGFYTYEVVNQYAREASRYAIVHGANCINPLGGGVILGCNIGTGRSANVSLLSYLNQQIYPGINGANLTVNTTYTHAPGLTTCFAPNCNGAGDQVTVQVSYPYLYNIPFVPSRSLTMNASSTMVISQ